MISFKQGIRLYGIRPEMVVILIVCYEVFQRHNQACVVTSVSDGHRGTPSLHNVGDNQLPESFALDLRSVHITDLTMKNRILGDLKVNLPFCDVLLHAVAGGAEHYHVEFDPKDDPVFQAKKQAWKNGEDVNF